MIYLDNCSTTEMREEVIEKMTQALREDFANPSSLHGIGFNVEKNIENARDIIGRFLGVKSGEVYFTSGGTESNNLAIYSSVKKLKSRGNHLITTSIEHPSVMENFKNLENLDYDVTYLSVGEDGNIDIDEFKTSLREDTILVSIMQVNNEIGTILNLADIKEEMRKKNDFSIFHVDGVQAFGKIDFSIKNLGIDLYSFSGHKVYGPKGVGGLYINENIHLDPVIFGGHQEKGFRSGTENAPAIIAFGEAVRILGENFTREENHVREIKSYFLTRIREEIPRVKINGSEKDSSPYIINISIEDTRGEVLLHYLEDDGIYISTSSACSSNDTKKSHVLKGIGLSNKDIEGSIRICFSYKISKDDIDYTIERLKFAVKEVREIIMR